jgi:hypothetical protein
VAALGFQIGPPSIDDSRLKRQSLPTFAGNFSSLADGMRPQMSGDLFEHEHACHIGSPS